MTTMNPEYIEKIYAGWLAKVIGVRLGAPIEGWTLSCGPWGTARRATIFPPRTWAMPC